MSVASIGSLVGEYAALSKNGAKSFAKFRASPKIQAEIAYFKTHIATVRSVDELLKDQRLVGFILSAFSIDKPAASQTGVLKKLLTENPNARTSLAQRLADPRYRDLARTLDVFDYGLGGLRGNGLANVAASSTAPTQLAAGLITLTTKDPASFHVGDRVVVAATPVTTQSKSSLTFSAGAKAITVDDASKFAQGQSILVADKANPTRFVKGTITRITNNVVNFTVAAGDSSGTGSSTALSVSTDPEKSYVVGKVASVSANAISLSVASADVHGGGAYRDFVLTPELQTRSSNEISAGTKTVALPQGFLPYVGQRLSFQAVPVNNTSNTRVNFAPGLVTLTLNGLNKYTRDQSIVITDKNNPANTIHAKILQVSGNTIQFSVAAGSFTGSGASTNVAITTDPAKSSFVGTVTFTGNGVAGVSVNALDVKGSGRYDNFVVTPLAAAGKLPAPADLQQRLIDRYVLNQYEKSVGKIDPALREALYFERKAKGVTNVYGLLSDAVLRDVINTAIETPAAILQAPIAKQAAYVAKHVKVAKLNDPKYDQALIRRYLAVLDRRAASAGSQFNLLVSAAPDPIPVLYRP